MRDQLNHYAAQGLDHLEAYIQRLSLESKALTDSATQYQESLAASEDRLSQAKAILPLVAREMEELNIRLAELSAGIKYKRYLGTIEPIKMVSGFHSSKGPMSTIAEIEADVVGQRAYTKTLLTDYSLRIAALEGLRDQGLAMIKKAKGMNF